MAVLYKIIDKQTWEKAQKNGVFNGAAIDLQDGYIHLSSSLQVVETARLHFAGIDNLLLVAIDETAIATPIKWEASRGWQLFPHMYGSLDPQFILWAKPLAWNGTAHEFPELTA